MSRVLDATDSTVLPIQRWGTYVGLYNPYPFRPAMAAAIARIDDWWESFAEMRLILGYPPSTDYTWFPEEGLATCRLAEPCTWISVAIDVYLRDEAGRGYLAGNIMGAYYSVHDAASAIEDFEEQAARFHSVLAGKRFGPFEVVCCRANHEQLIRKSART